MLEDNDEDLQRIKNEVSGVTLDEPHIHNQLRDMQISTQVYAQCCIGLLYKLLRPASQEPGPDTQEKGKIAINSA